MSSEQNPVRVFVTHAWEADDEYLRVFEFLESARSFYYRNVSRPQQRPAGGRDTELEALRQQINSAEIVLALAAQHAQSSFWVDFEVTYARATRKPVVLLARFGAEGALPPGLRTQADETVEWNERAMVDAIRRQARHEQTNRWQTIDFTPD